MWNRADAGEWVCAEKGNRLMTRRASQSVVLCSGSVANVPFGANGSSSPTTIDSLSTPFDPTAPYCVLEGLADIISS